ncbi:MAG: GAF domain-containing protein [Planctomycetes bacterium]|nr:GAF domain-containing protein [Planctomycetota bacterium]
MLQHRHHRKKHDDRLLAAEHAVTRILATAAELRDAVPGVVRAICESLGWDCGAVWTLDKAAQVLRCVDAWHMPDVSVSQFEQVSRRWAFEKGIGLPGRIWSTEKPAWIPDVPHDANFPRAAIAAQEGLHAAFGFPIHDGVEFLGVLEFFSRCIRKPDQRLLDMMGTVGGQNQPVH